MVTISGNKIEVSITDEAWDRANDSLLEEMREYIDAQAEAFAATLSDNLEAKYGPSASALGIGKLIKGIYIEE